MSRRDALMLLLSESGIEYRTRDHAIRLTPLQSNPHTRLEGLAPTTGVSNYLKGVDPTAWRTNVPHYGRVRFEALYPGIDLIYYSAPQGYEFDFLVNPGADVARIRLKVEGANRIHHQPSGDVRLDSAAGALVLRKPYVYQVSGGRRQEIASSYRVSGDQVTFSIGTYDRSQPLIIDPVTSTYLGGRDVDIVSGVTVDGSSNIYLTGYTTSTDFARSATPYKSNLTPGDSDAFVMKLNPAGTSILYSTFLGGNSADFGRAIAVDSAGAAYITGSTIGRFPITAGVFREITMAAPAIFVTKLNPAGDALSYSTYLDGAGAGQAIRVDATGNAYVGGFTYTATFTTTPGAIQTTYGGATDAFVTKLNPTGTAQVYSTFLGGSSEDQITGLRVDSTGAVYVAGFTGSSNFQTTSGVVRTLYGGATDAFVAKLNVAGSALVYSTFLGGSNTDRAFALDIDSTGHAYVTGQTASTSFPTTSGVQQANFGGGAFDAFVSKLNPTATALSYSTFLGGSGNCSLSDPFRLHQCDSGQGISVDASGRAFVTGFAGAGFPMVSADQSTFGGNGDAFVAQFNETGTALAMSTYLGGGNGDIGLGIVRGATFAAAVGMTTSSDFPVTGSPLQGTAGGGASEGFLATYGTCAYSLGSSGSFFPNSAATYSFELFTGAGCPWAATTTAPWITVTTPTGTGSGSVSFSLTANGGGLRTGTITVQGQTYTVQQVGGACVVTLGSTESWFPNSFGLYSVPVLTNPGCAWTASTADFWINVTIGAGTGSANMQFALSVNSGSSPRTGLITVTGGNTYTVRQVGAPGSLGCSYNLSKQADVFERDGGSSSIYVNTSLGCEWSTANPNDWIMITAGFAGSGPGILGYTVKRNTTGQTRMGQITVAGQPVTIMQNPQ
ncbi:MAG: SBBP repeat-containing protein [Bryobacterales bacterium]|nr:SBBP repeat-containing protein [Bryobacterales bacterium]